MELFRCQNSESTISGANSICHLARCRVRLRCCRSNGCCTGLNRRCADEVIVAALDVWMILVAGDEKNYVLMAVGECTVTDDLSTIVDVQCIVDREARAGESKRLQIGNGAVLPQETVIARTLTCVVWVDLDTKSGAAYHLIVSIHTICRAGGVA